MGPVPTQSEIDAESFFAAVGGEPTFRRLVGEFYAGVAQDLELRAIYPEQDLAPAADRLALFLIQYWGGPTTYSTERGHPRLRMRHAPFVVDQAQRERWLRHMRAALDVVALPPAYDRMIWDYFTTAATSMLNTDG
ncbi:MAG: globin [Jatrophihabitantaceae bacterium]